MTLYDVESTIGSEEVLQKALAYFGPQGLGLAVSQPDPCCLEFRGGGGHVTLLVRPTGRRTVLELDTQAWDLYVRKFMRRVAR